MPVFHDSIASDEASSVIKWGTDEVGSFDDMEDISGENLSDEYYYVEEDTTSDMWRGEEGEEEEGEGEEEEEEDEDTKNIIEFEGEDEDEENGGQAGQAIRSFKRFPSEIFLGDGGIQIQWLTSSDSEEGETEKEESEGQRKGEREKYGERGKERKRERDGEREGEGEGEKEVEIEGKIEGEGKFKEKQKEMKKIEKR